MDQELFRARLLQDLGGEWPTNPDLNVQHRETIHCDGYRIESICYQSEVNDLVPAYLLIPSGINME